MKTVRKRKAAVDSLNRPQRVVNVAPPSAPPAPLPCPEKITLKWVHEHVPITMIVGFSGAIFMAGVTFGNFDPVKTLFVWTVQKIVA